MNILVLTYFYPSASASSGHRWAAMTKYLRRLGHSVIVVTAAPRGEPPGTSDGVIRTRDLESDERLRRLMRRPEARSGSVPANATRGAAAPLVSKVLVPDAHLIGWNPWAERAARRIIRQRAIDCLITSGPPDSSHLLGFGSIRHGCAWIADFRDGWLFEPPRESLPTAPQRALERLLERRVVRRADAVVAVTRPIAEDFESRLKVPAHVISNGWDPELMDASRQAPDLLDARRFSIVHTGTPSGAWGRSPRALVAALRRVRDLHPLVADQVEVVFAGSATGEDLALLNDPSLGRLVRYVGTLDRADALALQRAADALLLLTSDNRSEATGKLFEYLGASRPILALAENNEAARIIGETATGTCVSPHDVDAIATQILGAMTGDLDRRYAGVGLERYSYPGLATQMADLIGRTVSARRLRNSLP